jgi:hypothetical protein
MTTPHFSARGIDVIGDSKCGAPTTGAPDKRNAADVAVVA